MDESTRDRAPDTPRRSRLTLLLWGLCLATILGGVALFVVSVRREGEKARKSMCKGTFAAVNSALHDYHDHHFELPAAWTVDASGTRLHSWRLMLSPYLDSQRVLTAADLSQPWDAPVNRPLLESRPPSWGCPSHPNYQSGFSHKAAVTGAGTVFDGKDLLKLKDISDGPGNTVWFGEVTSPLPWTKPEDVDALAHPTIGDPAGFSSVHRGVHFAFCDGHTRTISPKIDPEIMKRLFLRSDGAAVTEEDLDLPLDD
ncbi:MAG: DUF1559 domain-containing protein [Planctomycetaceae bacterium]|nr:DUF1559 domain-containing protein [Planctomycetaceae bacterium]